MINHILIVRLADMELQQDTVILVVNVMEDILNGKEVKKMRLIDADALIEAMKKIEEEYEDAIDIVRGGVE